jgi:hypothetical protein
VSHALALALVALVLGAPATAGGGWAPAERVGHLRDPYLDEVSGLAASRRQPGLLWAVEDGGNSTLVYGLRLGGHVAKVVGGTAIAGVDVEEIASGPGPSGPALYVADIGDNGLARDELAVYRVREPAAGGSTAGGLGAAERLAFRYPDGPHDAEAILVDPRSGRLFVITKSLRGARLYALPAGARAGVVTLVRLPAPALADVALVTGASVTPGGDRVVVRTYLSAYEFVRPAGRPLQAAFRAQPARIALPLERQGEAIAYTAGGRALVTTSEGAGAPIWRIRRLSSR